MDADTGEGCMWRRRVWKFSSNGFSETAENKEQVRLSEVLEREGCYFRGTFSENVADAFHEEGKS